MWHASLLRCVDSSVLKAGGSDGENPKAAAVREQLRKRLSEQEEQERATKTELVQKAASYLEQFYEVIKQSARPAQEFQPNQAQHNPCCSSLHKLLACAAVTMHKTYNLVTLCAVHSCMQHLIHSKSCCIIDMQLSSSCA